MGLVGDLCRKMTLLNAEQIELLESVSGVLELAGDLAYAQITVYTRASSENYLVSVAQTTFSAGFGQHRANLLGTTVHSSQEPMVWRTLNSGERITGQREWALGMDVLEMQTFPIMDRSGEIIAVASFESSFEDEEAIPDHSMLVESAFMLLLSECKPSAGSIYRPLTARDGVMIVGERGQIIFANAAASSIFKILGVGRLIGRKVYDRQVNLRLAQKAANNRQACETELDTGNMVLAQRAIPIVQEGQTVRTIVIMADVTELKKKEKELLVKSAVIQEIHHRVKNNLQTVASLLRLQARRSDSGEVKAALRESVNRILSISVVHEFLSQQDAEIIDVAEVAKNILDLVIQNMLEPGFNLQTIFNGQTVILPSDQATSLALAINELIQNSIEHGFTGRCEGVIGIDIATVKDCYQIDIYDNGIGLPENFGKKASGSLGLQIVRTLVENDLGGRFNLYSNAGTHACITIPRIVEGG